MDHDSNDELGFKDYIAVLKRRGTLFAGIVAPILTLGVALAFGLPPVYESAAVLLAEQGEVPEYIVRSTIPDFPEERVRRITDRVMTDENLAGIVQERDPYPDLEAEGTDAAVREMRRNLISGVEDPAQLRELLGTTEQAVAFRIGFAHSSPETARAVASDLVDLYMTENQEARQELAAQTLAFLQVQAERLESEIAAREAELAEFKSNHANRLPEQADMNMSLLDRTERELQTTETEIRTLRERVSLIQSDLSQLSPYRPVLNEQGVPLLSPTEQLKLLQRQYAQAVARYSMDHPNVTKLKREIDALSAQTGLPGLDRSILETTLASRLEALDTARNRYGDDHPTVRGLEVEVEQLRAQIAEAPRAASGTATNAAPPDNPPYLQRQVELRAANADLAAAIQRRDELRNRLDSVQERLSATPEVEREYRSLSRGYDQLVSQYTDVKTKQREAEIALDLETESKGERFRVLQSARLPSLPAQPNRIAILLLAFALAFAAGAGGVAVAEVSDSTVRAPRDVSRLLEIPPLVMIPYIDNEADLRSRRWKRLGFALTVVAWIGVTAFFITNPAG